MGEPAPPGVAPPGAERKLVTVLLADVDEAVEDFTEPDPEDVARMLARHLARVRAEVEAFGGTVEQTVGGRTVAVFGVPRTRTDDPERAVRAALAIRDALSSPGLGGPDPRTGPGVRLHVAVATGEALVRPGTAAAGRQRVLGDPVTVCARLLEIQREGAVLVTEATGRATERTVSYAPAGAIALGGGQPVAVWSALGLRTDPVEQAGQRPSHPLVARTRELGLLLDRFETARGSGTPHLVTLVGPPGIGKSRLVAELAGRVRAGTDPATWCQGCSLPYGHGVTFWALSMIVKAQAGILETDTAAQAERKLARAAAAAVPDPDVATWVAGKLRRLVGASAPAGPASGDREEAFAAWRRFLYGLARRRPLVLAVEDLHWADDALLDFLERLAAPQAPAEAGPIPLLVVATARPELLERRPDWAAGPRDDADAPGPGTAATPGPGTADTRRPGTAATPGPGTADTRRPGTAATRSLVALEPLSDRDTGQLLEALLARHGLPGTVEPALLARVGGNPLFAEEYVRMLRDRGAMGPHGDREASASAAAIPETVHAIVAARLDALPPGEKAVLQDAAVLGQAGWVGALTEIGHHERAGLEARLRRLEQRELLHRAWRSRVAGEVEYAFSHVLVRDVAYGQIVRAERAGKHRRAAAWIEALASDRAEDRAELLAYHYQAALGFARAAGQDVPGLADRARAALRDAGDRAAALGAWATAARYHAQARDLCPPGDPELPALELRLGRARCQGEGAGQEELARARDGLLAGGERALAAEAEMLLGELAFLHGRGEERAARLDRALALAADAPPSRSKAAVLKGCMMHLVIASRHAEAHGVAEEVLAMAGGLGLHDLEADAIGTIGLARVDAGDARGLADLERATAILESLSSPGSIVWHLNLAYAHAALGDLVRSSAALSAASRAAGRFGSMRRLRSIALQRVAECYWAGRWDEAVRIVDEDLAGDDRERHYLEWECRVWRGRIRLARGRVDAALEDAQAALALATDAADPQALNPARAFGARALLAAGRTDAARRTADELLAGLGGSALGPDLGADLGAVLAALGYPDEALDARRIPPSAWLEAARALVAGEPHQAAEVYARIGSRPDEAYARLAAAGRAWAAGAVAEGEAELAAATAFYREVGAGACLAEAEAMRARQPGASTPAVRPR
jgi:class 3 adenylate cyclase